VLTRRRRRPEDEETCGGGRVGKAGVECVGCSGRECGGDDRKPNPGSTGCWAWPGPRDSRSPKQGQCAESGSRHLDSAPRRPAPPLSSTPAAGSPQESPPGRALRVVAEGGGQGGEDGSADQWRHYPSSLAVGDTWNATFHSAF
jgi:hypothetical protein